MKSLFRSAKNVILHTLHQHIHYISFLNIFVTSGSKDLRLIQDFELDIEPVGFKKRSAQWTTPCNQYRQTNPKQTKSPHMDL